MILDEIATGFWRTGTAFGRDHGEERPDIVCVGKALTGGYLTLAAVLCTAEVAAAGERLPGRRDDARPDVHGEPARLRDRLRQPRPARDSTTTPARIVKAINAGARRPAWRRRASWRRCVDVRTIGAVGVVELDTPVDVVRVTEAALDRGVWVRPFRNLVYTMPPYVTSTDDLPPSPTRSWAR